jgi:Protein of unknown function (DUF2877)
VRLLRSASDLGGVGMACDGPDTHMWCAKSIGEAVARHAAGTVHSVFRHACNIETAGGGLVTLLASSKGNSAHGIRLAHAVAPLDARLFAGQKVVIEQALLCVPDAAVRIDLSGASVWRGEIAAVHVDASARALSQVRSTLCERAGVHGFAAVLFAARPADSAIGLALQARLSSALPALAQATASQDSAAVAGTAAQLVGLGPGLTPSGDDFLTGYLAALRSRGRAECGIAALLKGLDICLTPLFPRTNAISRQMLRDAVQGRFAEHLVELVNAVAHARDVVGATVRVLETGYSSGADTVCGLLFGYAPSMVRLTTPAPLTMRSKPCVVALA